LETRQRDHIDEVMAEVVGLYARSVFTFVMAGDSATSARTFSAVSMLSIPGG
jgi:hypothetical protein